MKVITDYDNQKSGLLLLYIIIFTIIITDTDFYPMVSKE